MAIVVTCPTCGNLSQVPDQAAGSAVRCPHCAAVMEVPAPAASQAEAQEAAPQSGSRTPNYFNQVAPAPQTYSCATCGGSFAVTDVLDQHGTIICQDCYAAAVAQHADDAAFPSAHSIPVHSDEHAVSEEDHSDRHDTVSFEPVATSVESSGASAPGKKPRDFLPLLIGGAFGAIILGGVIVYVASNNSKPEVTSSPVASAVSPNPAQTPSADPTEWELKNSPHLERLRSQAKSLEASGDLPGALSRYQEMLNFAASPGAKIRSDAVLAELTDARSRWEVLVKIVKPVDQTAPPPTPDDSVASAAPNRSNPPDSEKPSVPTQENEKPEKHPTPSATAPAVVENPSSRPHPSAEPAPAVVEDEANWPANHIPEIQALLAKAQEAAKGPDKVAALSRYEQVLRLVQGHEKQITDSELKKNLAAANDQRKQLLAAVRDSDETRQATARSLLAAGLKSLRDSKWKTAEESLADARHVTEKMSKPVDYFKDDQYVATLHALAVAYLENKNVQRAGEMFNDDAPLGRIASTKPTREMIWNRAVTDVTQKFNIMRTVKMLRDYLEKHPDPPDEDLINLFGTALNTADETNPTNRKLLDDAIGYYGVLNTQLEKTHPGQRRWGAQWLPEADAQAKYDDQSKYIEIFQQKVREKELAGVKLKEAQQNADGIRRAPGAEAAVTAAKNALTDAERAAQAARAAIPRAAWLTDIKPMIPPETSVAMVTPPPASSLAPSQTPPPPSSSGPDSSSTPPAQNPTPAPSTSPPAAPADPSPPVVVPSREVRYAAAFPVDRTHLITASDPLGTAGEVRLEDTQGNVFSARVVAKEGKLALLEVSPGDVGGSLRYFNLSPAFAGGPVRCAAIPEANVFGPSVALLTADSVPVPRGPKWSVALSEHPRLAGSPLLDSDNAVVGVVVADREDPKTRLPAIPVKDISEFLQAQHIVPATSTSVDPVGIYQVAAESE